MRLLTEYGTGSSPERAVSRRELPTYPPNPTTGVDDGKSEAAKLQKKVSKEGILGQTNTRTEVEVK